MTVFDPITLQGREVDTSRGGVDEEVRSIVDHWRDELVRVTVVVVPDLHYPFHPSTGLVTDPAVVEAVVEAIQDIRGTDVVVGCRSGPHVATGDAMRLLGYRGLSDRLGVECIDLGEEATTRRRLRLPDGPVGLDVPAPLDRATIVTVPTLRLDPSSGLCAGMTTLATAMQPDEPSPAETWAAASLCDPTLSVLDATTTYTGESRRPGYLLAGTDSIAVDAVVADAVGQAPAALDDSTVREATLSCTVEGRPPEDALGGLPRGRLDRSGEPNEAMAAGYRLYARLTGDAVPPQFAR